MTNIALPEKFSELLSKNQKLQAIVGKCSSDFGEILLDNTLFFFEEYTDHGIKHIENVLFSTDRMITSSTWDDVLKAEDIAFYVLAVILHDIGMHLSFEGFQTLINGQHDELLLPYFKDKKWSDLWQDYLSETKRFNEKQLLAIFGDQDVLLRNPVELKKSELNGNDKKLIGEFIRRHHPRIAHEIALVGFPGKIKSSIKFAEDIGKKQRDIIGLVARSHGIKLRSCVEYLEIQYGNTKRTPFGVHAGYLMILLRLCDYLQIDSSRTSFIILKTRTFDSPISLKEHEAHLAIDYIDDSYQDDPERIYVNASPKDSSMYLKLKELFKDIQNEFDTSWAVLGELYGVIKKKPSIKYRRISSNLDNDNYILSQDYVGDHFSFKADGEIIKLLIAPLYGKNPMYGLREMLQNSLDACNERLIIEEQKNRYTPHIQVEIIEEENNRFIKITDNGKGMTIDVIKNFFLNAGASFRTSLEWRQKFIDESGNTKVQRSGRFGIGVLAGFLLGKVISVKTRGLNAEYGYSFEIYLNSSQIDVKKVENMNFGTTIKILSDPQIIENLVWTEFPRNHGISWTKWYTLSFPKIVYKKYGIEFESYYKKDPHYLNYELEKNWNAFDFPGFTKILWTYDNTYSNQSVVCNGIVVQNVKKEHLLKNNEVFDVPPNVSIFDYNGITPLTLNRNGFVEPPKFSDALIESICMDYIASILCKKDFNPLEKNIIDYKSLKINYPGIKLKPRGEGFYKNNMERLIVSKKGFVIDYHFFLEKLRDRKFIYFLSNSLYSNPNFTIEIEIEDTFMTIANDGFSETFEFVRKIYPERLEKENLELGNTRVFLRNEMYEEIFQSNKWFSQNVYDTVRVEKEINDWVAVTIGNPSKSLIKDSLLTHGAKFKMILESEISHSTTSDVILDTLLERFFGDDVVIPYELEARKKKFPLAFKELSNYMRKYL